MNISIIGTVGVPANYGGFETLVDQLVSNKISQNLSYTIYCSSKNYKEKIPLYKNATLKYINLKANGIQSIAYDILSLIKATKNSDTILILGVSGCVFLPIYRLFSKKKLIINIDGLEHKRNKWNPLIRKFLKFSEKMAIRYGNIIVADNKGITDYVNREYNINPQLIAYGGDHVLNDVKHIDETEILKVNDIEPCNYSLGICRIEPENNVHIILEAFANTKENLILLGNWNNSQYGKTLLEKYINYKNIKLIDSNYDLNFLYVLRNNCKFYLHGHSAGGTNPSLVEAMFFKKPIIAFDCVYNRETTENKATYFSTSEDIIDILSNKYYSSGESMFEIAKRRYTWKSIANQYEILF